jgi:Family of unknown function (DUF6525)
MGKEYFCPGHSTNEHMRAYDRLPAEIREYLANHPSDLCPVSKLRQYFKLLKIHSYNNVEVIKIMTERN